MSVEKLGRGYAWLDTGTHDSLLEAASLIKAIQHRQGVQIACPEEIALGRGWITPDQAAAIGRQMGKTEYGRYVLDIAKEHRAG